MPEARKTNVNLPFPVGGIADGSSHTNQPENTTHDAKNVVPFDTSEDRLRGGRRRGIKRLSGTALTTEKVQLMLSSDLVNTSGELSSGGISQHSSESDYAGYSGVIDYSSMSDGSLFSPNVAGFPLYGYSGTTVRNTAGGYGTVLSDPDSSSKGHTGYGGCLLQGLTSSQSDKSWHQRPVIFPNGGSPGFLIKQTDDNNLPYLLVDPARFEYNLANNDGVHSSHSKSPDQFWHVVDNAIRTDGLGEDFYNNNDAVKYWKAAHMFPAFDIDEQPWNSAKGKTYCTKMEFQPPRGCTHSFPNGQILFVDDVTDETTDQHLHDAWYRSFLSAGTQSENRFKFEDGPEETIGLLFRVGANYSRVQQSNIVRSNWSDDFWKNTQTQEAFYVYVERAPNAGYDGKYSDTAWNLYLSPQQYRRGPGHPANDGQKLIAENVIAGDDVNYHTLEVRVNNNRVDVYFDGILQASYSDITAEFSTIVNTAGTNTSPSNTFGFAGIGYTRQYEIKRTGGSGSNQTRTEKQLSYWGSYDFGTRENSSGHTVNNEHTDTRGGSHSWRLRSLEWREANANSSESKVVVAISGGKVFETENGSSYNSPTQINVVDSGARVVDGVSYLQKVYLVDGKNYRVYDPGSNAIADWNADGEVTLPGGDGTTGLNGTGTYDENARCSIIEVYNGRIVMAGKSDEPHNWFMSAIGDPLDWNLAETIEQGGAVTGSSTTIGESSSAITALIPTSDDRLVVASSTSMHILTGDPAIPATQFISLSRDVGIVGQNAGCYGPNKTVYFMGENGLYTLQPNQYDVTQSSRISLGKLDSTISKINFATYHCRLVYEHGVHGIHVFLTPVTRNSDPLQHFFYDTRTESFWEMECPSVVGPTASVDFNNLDPDSRKLLLGGYDGNVRMFDSVSKDDDGTKIDSHVWIGPLQIGSDREAKLTQLIAVLDEQTDGLGYEIYAADTVEAAKASEPIVSGEWSSGRNASARMRVRGSAIFVRLKSDAVALPWSIESLTATLAVAGKVRQR